MNDFRRMSKEDLEKLRQSLQGRYREFQSRNLRLDMTRGKPCSEQLDLSMEMLEGLSAGECIASDGTDCRNYGGLPGIPEARKLFAAYLEVEPDEIIVAGNSSLNLMYDAILGAMLHGMADSLVPWGKLQRVRFLCPVPGYDRHFTICESLGIEMIALDLKDDGPDMKAVEEMVAEDETIKGIWCVPRYSNPTGITYSDEVVERLAAMKTRAPDFKIFWDNAYAVHHLLDHPPPLKNILQACKKAGNPDRVLIFGSTSKITFPGAGVAMMASSRRNIEFRLKKMSAQTIGPDKLNQLRHVRFFKDLGGIQRHMRRHAAILRPKFEAVQGVLERELAGKGIATWSRPHGGYFISLDTLEGCADRVVRMAEEAGVSLTPGGSTFPYGKDPRNRNIRLAPTFPPLRDVTTAMEVLAVCIQLVSIERIMQAR